MAARGKIAAALNIARKYPKKAEGGSVPFSHKLEKGENPSKVAKRFVVKLDEIMRLNQLDEEKATKLPVGHELLLREPPKEFPPESGGPVEGPGGRGPEVRPNFVGPDVKLPETEEVSPDGTNPNGVGIKSFPPAAPLEEFNPTSKVPERPASALTKEPEGWRAGIEEKPPVNIPVEIMTEPPKPEDPWMPKPFPPDWQPQQRDKPLIPPRLQRDLMMMGSVAGAGGLPAVGRFAGTAMLNKGIPALEGASTPFRMEPGRAVRQMMQALGWYKHKFPGGPPSSWPGGRTEPSFGAAAPKRSWSDGRIEPDLEGLLQRMPEEVVPEGVPYRAPGGPVSEPEPLLQEVAYQGRPFDKVIGTEGARGPIGGGRGMPQPRWIQEQQETSAFRQSQPPEAQRALFQSDLWNYMNSSGIPPRVMRGITPEDKFWLIKQQQRWLQGLGFQEYKRGGPVKKAEGGSFYDLPGRIATSIKHANEDPGGAFFGGIGKIGNRLGLMDKNAEKQGQRFGRSLVDSLGPLGAEFNPAPIAKAVNAMPDVTPAIFAGIGAKTADLNALTKAKGMELEGVAPHKIWRETGWGRGADKVWKFEIDDSGFEFKSPKQTGQYEFNKHATHPELEQAYPGILDKKLLVDEDPGYWGGYDSAAKEYLLSRHPMRMADHGYNPRSIFAHELQHGVADIEKFPAIGMNPEHVIPIIVENLKKRGHPAEKAEELGRLLHDRSFDESLKYAKRNPRQPVPRKNFRFLKDSLYEREMGEVEARNVQKRLDWTPDVRRIVHPPATEDVPRDMQFLLDYRGQAKGGPVKKEFGGPLSQNVIDQRNPSWATNAANYLRERLTANQHKLGLNSPVPEPANSPFRGSVAGAEQRLMQNPIAGNTGMDMVNAARSADINQHMGTGFRGQDRTRPWADMTFVPMKADKSGLIEGVPDTGGYYRAPGGTVSTKMGPTGLPKIPTAKGLPPQSVMVQRAAGAGMASRKSGLLKSVVPGRTDKLAIGVANGSYVIPADIVAGHGQGNTLAGAAALDKLFKSGPYGTSASRVSAGRSSRPPSAPRMNFINPQPPVGYTGLKSRAMGGEADVPVMAAGGEYILDPEQVATVGKGDVERGFRILDQFVLQSRKKQVKEIKGLRPPKKD